MQIFRPVLYLRPLPSPPSPVPLAFKELQAPVRVLCVPSYVLSPCRCVRAQLRYQQHSGDAQTHSSGSLLSSSPLAQLLAGIPIWMVLGRYLNPSPCPQPPTCFSFNLPQPSEWYLVSKEIWMSVLPPAPLMASVQSRAANSAPAPCGSFPGPGNLFCP